MPSTAFIDAAEAIALMPAGATARSRRRCADRTRGHGTRRGSDPSGISQGDAPPPGRSHLECSCHNHLAIGRWLKGDDCGGHDLHPACRQCSRSVVRSDRGARGDRTARPSFPATYPVDDARAAAHSNGMGGLAHIRGRSNPRSDRPWARQSCSGAHARRRATSRPLIGRADASGPGAESSRNRWSNRCAVGTPPQSGATFG